MCHVAKHGGNKVINTCDSNMAGVLTLCCLACVIHNLIQNMTLAMRIGKTNRSKILITVCVTKCLTCDGYSNSTIQTVRIHGDGAIAQ